ncbi:MAG: hypothetical protein WBC54_02360, partial [Rhodococcus sp. (in: high G+C Gram-positive bacteria)]
MSRGPTRRRILIGAAAAATVAVVGPVAKAVAAPATGSGDECGERYQGYRDADRNLPYARYMAQRTTPAPAVVADTCAGPALAPDSIPEFDSITTDLA